MSAQRTVLVLGGGVGGLVASRRLRKLLPRRDRVVLVDRQPCHLFQPSLLWLAVGERQLPAIQRPLSRLARHGIEVVLGEIEAIDPEALTVRVAGQELRGDAMIVALGAELADGLVPGLADGGVNLYTAQGASALHQRLAALDKGRVVLLTADPVYKCPAAPYEASMLIEAFLRRCGVRRRVEISLYAAEPGPMGVAGPAVSAAVRSLVEAKGIRYYPEHRIVVVDPERRTLVFDGGTTAEYDVLAYVPPHRAPAVLHDAGLLNDTGWIPVDRRSFATAFPGVFAVGDATIVPLAMGKPLPKAGVFAHGQAEVVVRNLAADWLGRRSAPASFDGYGKCWVEAGDGRAGFGAGNFYAEPLPTVRLYAPARWRHWQKVWFERWWLWRWF